MLCKQLTVILSFNMSQDLSLTTEYLSVFMCLLDQPAGKPALLLYVALGS